MCVACVCMCVCGGGGGQSSVIIHVTEDLVSGVLDFMMVQQVHNHS